VEVFSRKPAISEAGQDRIKTAMDYSWEVALN